MRQQTPAVYRQRAETTMAYIQKYFWDPQVGRYHPAQPPKFGSLPFDFMWGNGVAFSALVGGARLDPATYRPLMESFLNGLEGYWDRRAPIPGYDAYLSSPGNSDKYYDDNAWMAITYAEAHAITGDGRYRDKAEAVMKYVLSGWDDKLGGGIYWRQDHRSKNTCSNGPSATAATLMAERGEKAFYTDWARRIVAWTDKNLQSPDGLFYDNINLDGKVEKTEWTYNTALMLRANLGLFRLTRDASYLRKAKRTAAAAERTMVLPETGAFRDDALFSHLLAEAFLDLYRTTGEAYLLNRARANADFAWDSLRDPSDGGFWTRWRKMPDRKEERKTLIASASVARLFWLLAAVPDSGAKAALGAPNRFRI